MIIKKSRITELIKVNTGIHTNAKIQNVSVVNWKKGLSDEENADIAQIGEILREIEAGKAIAVMSA